MARHCMAMAVTLLLLFSSQMVVAAAAINLPLFTNSSWIVDSSGARVRLACVSWAGHMEAGIPEGLSKNTVSNIAHLIKSTGFNCVRLTSATWLWTRTSSTTTVADNLQRLNLTAAIAGIRSFNPSLLQRSLHAAHTHVVEALAAHDLMVILDNHVSKPQWCCSDADGNGFWGDEFFDPEEWLQGLEAVATSFRGTSHVVGMSLRNELRGPNQSSGDWLSIVPKAAHVVHAANPSVLIIAGGLSYASNLAFLSDDIDFAVPVPGKFVYEFHWYKWFARHGDYDDASDADACARNVEVDVRGSAHSRQTVKVPHFLSEFGVKQEGDLSYGDGRFLECVIAYWREDPEEAWALWALQGSYYLRNGVQDLDETFGVVDSAWHEIRNPELIARLRPIQGHIL